MMNKSFSHEFNTGINPGIMIAWPLNRRSGALGFGPSSVRSMSLSFPKWELVLPSQPVLLICTQPMLTKYLLRAVTTPGTQDTREMRSCLQHRPLSSCYDCLPISSLNCLVISSRAGIRFLSSLRTLHNDKRCVLSRRCNDYKHKHI